MPTIRTFTPQVDPETDMQVKLQVWVSLRDKRTIMAAIGDDGIFTFVIRTQFKRLVNFIQKHDLTSYDPTSIARIVEFVRNGTDTCIDRPATAQHDTGAAKGVQHPDAPTPSKPSSVGTGGKTRVRSKTKK